MKMEKIKPIPQYMKKLIQKIDEQQVQKPTGYVRFYSYLTKNDGELVKVTVAVRNQWKRWHCKQVAVHGIDSDKCFVKDLAQSFMGSWSVGWYAEGLTKSNRWFEDNNWGWHYDRYFDPHAYCVNKEYVKKFPELKYSALELYQDGNVLGYLRLYRKYPQMEYLMKIGLGKYATSVQLLKLIGKSKPFQKWLTANREKLAKNHYYVSTVITAFKKGSDLDYQQKYEDAKKSLCSSSEWKPIRDLFQNNYVEYLQYIGAQKISNNLYLDYLRACLDLGIDMSLKKNRFPHDFMRWHDIRIDENKTRKMEFDKVQRKEFYDKFATVAQKYLPLQRENGAYLVILAKSPTELTLEGDALHHCVGKFNYDQKFVREESLIFFIRRLDAPDEPFVTVEYSLKSKQIVQCYAKYNATPETAITDYLQKKWLPYAKRTLKKIAA